MLAQYLSLCCSKLSKKKSLFYEMYLRLKENMQLIKEQNAKYVS